MRKDQSARAHIAHAAHGAKHASASDDGASAAFGTRTDATSPPLSALARARAFARAMSDKLSPSIVRALVVRRTVSRALSRSARASARAVGNDVISRKQISHLRSSLTRPEDDALARTYNSPHVMCAHAFVHAHPNDVASPCSISLARTRSRHRRHSATSRSASIASARASAFLELSRASTAKSSARSRSSMHFERVRAGMSVRKRRDVEARHVEYEPSLVRMDSDR